MSCQAVVYALACIFVCNAQVDETLSEGASGSDVVKAVVSRIADSDIFPNDNQLLRRIAYVESKDGTDRRTYRSGYHGGIWQVDDTGFFDTQDTVSHRKALNNKFLKIREVFNIDWPSVRWEDLRKPLYSGLAARLKLSNVEDQIPLSSKIEEQGQYWKDYYNSEDGAGTVEKFVEDVEALLKSEECAVNSDIFFILDASGSVGINNFNNVIKTFVSDFVSNLEIGPNDNQVGIIVFSDTARVEFYLNSYSTKAEVQTAIQNIQYDGGSTNTANGLCKLIQEGYTVNRGARLSSSGSVYRLAIVLTDGMSNERTFGCQFGTSTPEVAAAVHNFKPSIIVFAIGVTDSINFAELSTIASNPAFVSTANSFDISELQEIQEQLTYELCNRATVPISTQEAQTGDLDEGESIRYELPLPKDGVTLEVCAKTGQINLYASTEVTTPNSALYDKKLEVKAPSPGTEACDDVYIGQPKAQEKRRAVTETFNTTVFMTLTGMDEYNEFSFNSTLGDTTSGGAHNSMLASFATVVLMLGFASVLRNLI